MATGALIPIEELTQGQPCDDCLLFAVCDTEGTENCTEKAYGTDCAVCDGDWLAEEDAPHDTSALNDAVDDFLSDADCILEDGASGDGPMAYADLSLLVEEYRERFDALLCR